MIDTLVSLIDEIDSIRTTMSWLDADDAEDELPSLDQRLGDVNAALFEVIEQLRRAARSEG